jgi:hypothetical protein
MWQALWCVFLSFFLTSRSIYPPCSTYAFLNRLWSIYTLQFALAHAAFFDACTLSAHAKPPPDAPYDTVPVHVTFLDWIPGICSTLGLLITNLIDKERLLSEGAYGGEPSIIWRARLFLFIGFAMMAGGLAGSIVRPDFCRFVQDVGGLTCAFWPVCRVF